MFARVVVVVALLSLLAASASSASLRSSSSSSSASTSSSSTSTSSTTTVSSSSAPSVDGGWVSTASLTYARSRHTATALDASRQVLVTGGQTEPAALGRTAELYDTESDSWSLVAAQMTVPRWQHAAALLPDGTVLVTGGATEGAAQLNTCEIFDVARGIWRSAASMATARVSHTATELPDGTVLVVGGGDVAATTETAELYDPVTNRWTTLSPMSVQRTYHTATVLDDGPYAGHTLVIGGYDASEGKALASAEVFFSPRWIPSRDLKIARYGHTTTRLESGYILVAGGFSSSGDGETNTAELFDPFLFEWGLVGSMVHERAFARATLLLNGYVLVCGGYVDDASVDLYEIASKTWAPAAANSPAMPQPLLYASATRLRNGSVLVVGGENAQTLAKVAASEVFWYAVAPTTPPPTSPVPPTIPADTPTIGVPTLPFPTASTANTWTVIIVVLSCTAGVAILVAVHYVVRKLYGRGSGAVAPSNTVLKRLSPGASGYGPNSSIAYAPLRDSSINNARDSNSSIGFMGKGRKTPGLAIDDTEFAAPFSV